MCPGHRRTNAFGVRRRCSRRQVGVVDVSCKDVTSQQERCEVQAAGSSVRCSLGTEVIFTSTVVVAGDAQVHGVADISAELELMVTSELGPVVDELKLLLAFGERAIATGNAEAIAKAGDNATGASGVLRASLTADLVWAQQERSQTRRLRITTMFAPGIPKSDIGVPPSVSESAGCI